MVIYTFCCLGGEWGLSEMDFARVMTEEENLNGTTRSRVSARNRGAELHEVGGSGAPTPHSSAQANAPCQMRTSMRPG
jgi:hypothetical protein